MRLGNNKKMWNYRLIKDADRIFLAEVYYAQDGSPSMYADLSEVFDCILPEDIGEAWRKQIQMYNSAFTKAILNEMEFHNEFHSEE